MKIFSNYYLLKWLYRMGLCDSVKSEEPLSPKEILGSIGFIIFFIAMMYFCSYVENF